MTRNNVLFKILFAIEVALLPMVIFSYLFLPGWSVCLFIAGVLLAKIWLHIFNDKTKASAVIISLGNILVFSVLAIMYMATSHLNVALGVVSLVFIVLTNIFKICLFNKSISETIEAVDYCSVLFECLTIVGFAILLFYNLVTNIGLFALILTGVVSVVYKVYYTIKYTNFISTLKNLFKRN